MLLFFIIQNYFSILPHIFYRSSHTESMENLEYDSKIELKSKSLATFVIGIVMSVVAVVLFFVGRFGVSMGPMWIATAVVGGIGFFLLLFSAHSTDGWLRMISVLTLVALTVVMTYMATIMWA